MDEAKLKLILEDFVRQLTVVLSTIQPAIAEGAVNAVPSVNSPAFFKEVRKSLFGGRLTAAQVSGMEAKLNAFIKAGFPVSWAAYSMATSYHETARRMQPVKEGLSASDAWRKRNLRYYPWYGRGDVQLTWKDNYVRADKELGLGGALVSNLDLALDPEISAEIMVRGMEQGWFSKSKDGVPHSLKRHLPKEVGTKAQFKQARRIINLMDKADLIADIAVKFQDALLAANYPKGL